MESEDFVLVEEQVWHDFRGWNGGAEAEAVAGAVGGVVTSR
jgi:hypothetical protein